MVVLVVELALAAAAAAAAAASAAVMEVVGWRRTRLVMELAAVAAAVVAGWRCTRLMMLPLLQSVVVRQSTWLTRFISSSTNISPFGRPWQS